MTQWRKTVNIKEVLHDEDMPYEDKPGAIASILTASKVFPEDLIEELRLYTGNAYDEDLVNELLEEIYDYADRNRIWLGL